MIINSDSFVSSTIFILFSFFFSKFRIMESIRKEGKKKKRWEEKNTYDQGRSKKRLWILHALLYLRNYAGCWAIEKKLDLCQVFRKPVYFFQKPCHAESRNTQGFFFFVNRVSLICRMRLQFCSVATYM